MVRYRGPKNRIARKFGVNIFGRARNPLIHKPNPPGMHGAKHKKKSDFGLQLEEKQKLRAVYGMLPHKQLVNAYKKSLRMTGNTGHLLLQRLECRLDNVVYRLRLTSTIFAAQQLVSHGHILVDGKRVDRRSFQVKPNMTISVAPKARKNILIQASVANTAREVPEYLELQAELFTGKLLTIPEPDQVPLPLIINIPLVCEYLAHSN